MHARNAELTITNKVIIAGLLGRFLRHNSHLQRKDSVRSNPIHPTRSPRIVACWSIRNVASRRSLHGGTLTAHLQALGKQRLPQKPAGPPKRTSCAAYHFSFSYAFCFPGPLQPRVRGRAVDDTAPRLEIGQSGRLHRPGSATTQECHLPCHKHCGSTRPPGRRPTPRTAPCW